jgi:hypothetical protein
MTIPTLSLGRETPFRGSFGPPQWIGIPLLFLFWGASIGVHSAPIVRNEPRTALEIQVLLTEDGSARTLGPFPVEIDPARGGHLSVPMERSGLLRIEARGTPGPIDGPHEVEVDALLELPSGKAVRAGRSLEISEGTTSLLEVYGDGHTRVMIALRAERVTRPVVQTVSGVDAPIRFQLAVERVTGEQSIPLETNTLASFLGEGVEYSFRRGEGDALETVRLVLTLLRIEGDIAEVGVEISASLPGSSAPIVLSRLERLLTTRGAMSSLTVADGTPPAGYRFLVTPQF